MALKETILDVRSKLQSIECTDQEGTTTTFAVSVWNNQVEWILNGDQEFQKLPAVYIETLIGDGGVVGQGMYGNDLIFRLHIVHEHLNTEGTFDEDLIVFALRDSIIRYLNRWKPLMCSPLQKINELPDYDHSNVYHYIIEFATHFSDTTGGDQDATLGLYQYTEQDVSMVLDVILSDQVNSVVLFSGPSCTGSRTTFYFSVVFNNKALIQNGTTFQLAFSLSGGGGNDMIISVGNGYTWDGVDTATVTDVDAFSGLYLEYSTDNVSCHSTLTLKVQVVDIQNLVSPGTQGNQSGGVNTFIGI